MEPDDGLDVGLARTMAAWQSRIDRWQTKMTLIQFSSFLEQITMEHIDIKVSSDSTLHFVSICYSRIVSRNRDIDEIIHDSQLTVATELSMAGTASFPSHQREAA